MARHGYLREYDEAPDRSENREDGWREQRWREDDWSDRNQGFMFDQDRKVGRDRGDEPQWTGSGESDWRRGGHGQGGFERDFSPSSGERSHFRGRSASEGPPRGFSSRQDDHYLSWRDRQIRALDNDYADYCREREQQFHSDFDTWRSNRQRTGKPAAAGEMAELELTEERVLAGEGNTPSPVGEATLGTSNSENSGPGRR